MAALSHVRAVAGRAALGVDLHLWIRELTRIDRVASSAARYLWSDDGALTDDGHGEPRAPRQPAFPAVYCRHCGRSGWGISLAAVGANLDSDDTAIRRNHAAHEGRFRALLYAPPEADHATADAAAGSGGGSEDGLRWFSVRQRVLLPEAPAEDDLDYRDGWILPVLTQVGVDADDDSRDDTCPCCQQKDGIRFLGSAIATLLSVTLSTLFGDEDLDPREKKALVFTDSVQDAAHRAGFVESRSHALTLRSVLRHAVGREPDRRWTLWSTRPSPTPGTIPSAATGSSRPTSSSATSSPRSGSAGPPGRYRPGCGPGSGAACLFDAVMEFGLQSRVGRTLEQTGSVAVEVDAGQPAALASIARAAIAATDGQDTLDGAWPPRRTSAWSPGPAVCWSRCARRAPSSTSGSGPISSTTGTATTSGVGGHAARACPPSREGVRPPPTRASAPLLPSGIPLLDPVTHAEILVRALDRAHAGVTAAHGARLARLLLERLARADVLHAVPTDSGGTVFTIPASSVVVVPTTLEDMAAGQQPARLHGLPRAAAGDRCGHRPARWRPVLPRSGAPESSNANSAAGNYYRNLYASKDMRRIVAREHTGLLDDALRLKYENGFKQGQRDPSAPNVLVATPTLEMGIDIGDLSAVLLASLPRTVASYLQRVGRAGRLTGNALNLAFVTGRGEHLPRLEDPLSVINGRVRPPATYLSAEEILQRQYVAHLVDCFARDENRPHPRRARDAAVARSPRGSFLGDLIAFAESGADDHLDRFPGQFHRTSPRPLS